jgi:hypothetical protein
VVPLVITLLNTALRYEREHQIMERGAVVVQKTWTAVMAYLSVNAQDLPQHGPVWHGLGSLLAIVARILGDIITGIEDGIDRAFTGSGRR